MSLFRPLAPCIIVVLPCMLHRPECPSISLYTKSRLLRRARHGDISFGIAMNCELLNPPLSHFRRGQTKLHHHGFVPLHVFCHGRFIFFSPHLARNSRWSHDIEETVPTIPTSPPRIGNSRYLLLHLFRAIPLSYRCLLHQPSNATRASGQTTHLRNTHQHSFDFRADLHPAKLPDVVVVVLDKLEDRDE